MIGPENYAEAERLREAARDSMNQGSLDMAAYFNQAAQVHATLALAAATVDQRHVAMQGDYSITPAWREVLEP